MKLVSTGNGHYWKCDDALGLRMNEVDRGDPPPTEITAFHMGNGLVLPATRKIQLDSLNLIGQGLFGPARGSGTKWTGDYQKFGIYEVLETRVRGILVISTNGCGMTAYCFDASHSVQMWRALCATLPPEGVWDVCQTIVRGYRAGREAERSEIYSAFVDGRLKKKRRNGMVCVEVAHS